MAKTPAERAAKSDNKNRANGWKQKKYWANDEEHVVLGKTLKELRSEQL